MIQTVMIRPQGSEYRLVLRDDRGRQVAAADVTAASLAALADACTELYNRERPEARVDLRKEAGE